MSPSSNNPLIDSPVYPVLDLRKTRCPLNFVQARLAMEKLSSGQILELWLEASGESAINVPDSLSREGYLLRDSHETQEGTLYVQFQKG